MIEGGSPEKAFSWKELFLFDSRIEGLSSPISIEFCLSPSGSFCACSGRKHPTEAIIQQIVFASKPYKQVLKFHSKIEALFTLR